MMILICCGITFCVGLCFFGIIFFFGSYETLEATEVGLDFDTTKIEVSDEKLYENGRYRIGLTHNFIIFPTNLQPMEFTGAGAIPSRSKDGL